MDTMDMDKDTEKMVEDLPKALIGWYDFGVDSRVLFISGGRPECETLFDVLAEKGVSLTTARLTGTYCQDITGSWEQDKTELTGNREQDRAEPSEDRAPDRAEPLGVPDLDKVRDRFDYIVAAGILERSAEPEKLLIRLRTLLTDEGKLLVGTENRLAIRYFCGDKDLFSGRVLDAIDGYEKIGEFGVSRNGGRAYSMAELEKMLIGAGFTSYRFYAVMPDLARPQILLADGYIPNEAVDLRIFPQYKSPGTVFLEEERLYEELLENHMFHQMANGFLIECAGKGTLSDADQITVQGDRKRREAMATVIKKGAWVSKKALYPEGQNKINALLENTEYLRRHNVPVTDVRTEGGACRMPFIQGAIATDHFRDCLRDDKDIFLKEIEAFSRIILDSSEHVPYEEIDWQKFDPWWKNRKKDDPNIDLWKTRAFGSEEERQDIGVILKRGYIDMVSINCFHTKQGFVFFDQEFFLENLPANVILIRTVDFIYRDNPDLERIFPKEELLRHFRLLRHQDTWRTMGNKFLAELRNEKELSLYHRMHRREARTVSANRFRMDYNQEEYDRLFTNIFKGVGGKKIYLFGSGKYAEQFLEQFGPYYKISGILDNKESRWGERLRGVEIYPPSVLKEIKEPFKVFVCIKYYKEVLLQMNAMSIRELSVYSPGIDYERPVKPREGQKDEKPKKYHTGYVAGVFDLFHIGHLNLLRRAKEQCDYLIVGVVSDEQVVKSKKTRPYIPFEERRAIVQACRYVDEAVMIPADKPNTEDAWYLYHFDAQFSGSDYADNPDWLARRVFLRQHGSEMVFLPYTETTSSTEIKEQISRRLFTDR